MLKTIAYIRRSTDKQDLSLDQQKEKLFQFAQAKQWHLVHFYADDAVSGSELSRPGLNALLDRIRTDDAIDIVLLWDRNRLARPKDPIDGMMLEREITATGKRIFYAATGQESDNSFNSKLMGLVEHYQNGDYLRKLSRDTIRGIVSRVKKGYWPGGPIPYGYDRLILNDNGSPLRIVRDQSDGSQQLLAPQTLEVQETFTGKTRYRKQDHECCCLIPSSSERVQAVQKIFRDYANGLPTRKIREELNQAGLRTYRGRPFTLPSIISILENPAYTGKCVYNRRTESKWHTYTDDKSVERQDEGLEQRPESDWIVTENAWAAIIDQESFVVWSCESI